MNLRKIILARYGLLLITLLLFSAALVSKIIIIQLTGSEKWEAKLKSLEDRTNKIQGNRGNICSYDGRVLATSIPFYQIRFDLGAPGVREVFSKEVDALCSELTKVFPDKSKAQFKKELTIAYQKKSGYHLVHPRKVNFDELQRIKDFPIFRRGKYAGGFIPEQEYVRFTPHGKLALRTIGLMNKGAYGGAYGSVGISGIEGKYEGSLRGEEGLILQQNLSGRWVNITSVEPENGKDIITTIDIYLQDVVENLLKEQLIRSEAEYGAAILMEVETGKIRAIANLGRQGDNYNEIYNYAIGHEGCTEPGSTFKLVSLMVALDEGVVDTSDVFDIEDGKWKVYDKIIYDSDYGHGEHGELTVKEIFERSSNVGVAKVIESSYGSREKEFIDRIYNLGLNNPLDLGFQGEAKPYIKYPTDKNWWGTSLEWISHGYEIELSPLQILTFYNALANNGKMMKPMFVEAISHNGKHEKTFRPEVLKGSICSNETLRKLRDMLEGVVENGTARGLKTSKYSFAGKTGTAKIFDKEHGYSSRRYRASFVGYFPAEKPKYSCMVVISEPKGAYYGGSVAGPVFRKIADCVYATDLSLEMARQENETKLIINHPNILNGKVNETKLICDEFKIKYIPPEGEADWVYTLENEKVVEMKTRKSVPNTMPNVLGMGAADAVYFIEKAGMKAKLNGFGRVLKQFPEPGVQCRKGQMVYIDLS
ncbi:MAG: PASTA domain-containing protein [Prolixibacteraceae bacterium]|nr:PASTA domain-containing protein [Prolixibacteraceae bacterium]